MIFSPDGKMIASSGWGVYLWETATGREILRITPETPMDLVGFSPDGATLELIAADQTLRFIEVSTGKETRKMSGPVPPAACSKDGKKRVSGSADSTAMVWQVPP